MIESIQRVEREYGGVDLAGYYRTTPRETVKREARAIMGGQGVYVKASHARRWDFVTAGYLDYFLSYAGTQKDPEGWIWKSAREMEEETGITPRQQERCREVLVVSGAIEAEKRGIGNKWNVRPNVPLLKLMDELPTFEEVAASVEQTEPETSRNVNSEAEVHSPQNVEPFPHHVEAVSHLVETHNRNTAVTPMNTLSARTRGPQPEERRGEKEVVPENISRSVAILGDIEGMSADARMLSRLVSTLAQKHPRVDPAEVCKDYRDKVAAMSEPVRNHRAYLAGHFEREAEKIANERPNPLGAGTAVFKASDEPIQPRPKIDFEEMQRLMDQGVPDAEAARRATMGDEERTVA